MSKLGKASAIPAAAREILEQVSRALEIKQMAKRPAPLQKNYKPAYQPLDLSREGYNTTQSIFPQFSIMGNNPRLAPGDSYGKGGRMQQLVDNMPAVSNVLAERIAPAVGSESGYFYHVGPIYEALRKSGLSDQEALDYVEEFSDLFGATSPKTNTLDNLRNASILQFKAGQGLPFDRKAIDGTPGNDRGFGMMDSHINRGAAYMNKQYDQAANPKPVNFAENSRGNLENVTVDTHVIRGAVDALEEVVGEGALNPNWLKKSARDTYKKEGRFSTATDVDDGLDAKKSGPYGGVTTQVEYSPMADMFSDVANKVGVAPGEGQALAWFGSGDKTGLVSTDRSIARLWQDRVAATAEMLGVSFDKAAKMVGKKQIPIYGLGGLTIAGAVGGSDKLAAAEASVGPDGYYNPDAMSAPTAALYEEPKSSTSKFWDQFQATMGGTRGLADTLLMGAAVIPSPIQIPAIAIESGLLARDAVNWLNEQEPIDPSERQDALMMSP